MPGPGQIQSLFSQKLDRAVFGTYFLGAVVPTAMLGVVLHRYVLPGMGRDGIATAGMIGLLVAVGLLSLASFFALRRLVRTALGRMDADNIRLATILAASRELNGALHAHAVADTAVGCALTLTDARAAYVLLQAAPEKPLLVCESAGRDAAALYQANQETIGEVLEIAIEGEGPTFLTGTESGEQAISALAVLPIIVADGQRGAFVLLHTTPDVYFSTEQIDAVTSLAGLTSVAFQNADLQNSQRNFFSHVTEMLVVALDAQLDAGDGRAGHSNRIAALANSVGRELGLNEERLERLHFASLLHDIGYLKIDRALHYDASRCRNHPMLGHRMLARIRLWQNVAPIVLSHHEWFDGSGYPESRLGADIPLESRALAVADVFDKLTHEDYEAPVLTVEAALAVVTEGAGTQFDPKVVEAFTAIIDRGELVA
jgi:putative nucleotidyltransferase with HDIG domain